MGCFGRCGTRFAGIAFKQYGAAFPFDEIIGAELTAVDQRQGKSIGDSTKLFHQIQGEGGAARA